MNQPFVRCSCSLFKQDERELLPCQWSATHRFCGGGGKANWTRRPAARCGKYSYRPS